MPAAVQISNQADGATVASGSQLGFTITLSNSGGSTANGLSITDALPSGTGIDWSIEAGDSDAGWSVSGTAPVQTLVYSPTTLAPGTSTTVHVVSDTDDPACGGYTNTASFSSTDGGSGSASASSAVDCTTPPPAPPPPPPPPAGSYASLVLADHPIAFWRVGETTGLYAIDSSGHGRTGTYLNGVALGVPGAIVGDLDTSARFDGVNDCIRVSDDAALRLNGPFSIEFWAKQRSFVNSRPGILYKGSSYWGGFSSYAVYETWNGTLRLDRSGHTISSNSGALTSSFRYFVVTYDGWRVRWYVDGVLKTTTSVSFSTNTSNRSLRIGRGYDYGKNDVDEVALYSSALSQARISAHYAAGS
jgi:uncharacterized repeat protein (TIGR01451 family)